MGGTSEDENFQNWPIKSVAPPPTFIYTETLQSGCLRSVLGGRDFKGGGKQKLNKPQSSYLKVLETDHVIEKDTYPVSEIIQDCQLDMK
uniref:Uncharacterized protein n=1 Tax=Romanomermis culicivorax TaxID=13658 RepID=A0A915JPB1_ROMCU